MNELEKLRHRQTAITDEQNAIVAAADASADKALTQDQRQTFDTLDAEFESNKTKIAALEADDQRRLRMQQRKDTPEPRRSAAGSGAPLPLVTKPQFEDDPKRGFKDHQEYLTCVMDASIRGSTDDQRLRYLTAGSDEQGTYSDPYGGFFLPTAFMPNVLQTQMEVDPIGARTTKIPMSAPIIKINARVDKTHSTSVSGGLRVYRRQETDDVTASRMEHEQVTLAAHSLFGVAYATEELLERSVISFIALLEAGFRDEFTSKLIDERLNGSGAGEFEGILNSPAVISIAKEVGQAAATLVYENIIKMRARVWGYASAIWLANHDTLPQLMLMNQSIGTAGVAIWQPSGREDHPDLLLGRPLFFTEYTKSLGTTGDIWCTNWSQYLEGTLSGPRSAESMHVRFLNHERTFKFWMENDGRGWWRSALTPKNGSTLSPFVKLDAR